MFKSLLAGIVFILCTITSHTTYAQTAGAASSGKVTEKKYADNGFFKYEITGNADVDGLNYADAKLKFKETNPTGYEQWVKQGLSSNPKANIPRKEFVTFSKEKQEHILSSPSLYNIVD